MERIHSGSVSLMAFMLAVFSMSMSWYLPIKDASFSKSLFILLIVFCVMIFISGSIAIYSNYVLNDLDKKKRIVLHFYTLAIATGMISPILIIYIM